MTLTQDNVRPGDVFKVTWKEREQGDLKDWCFEGILLVKDKETEEGEKILYDTYWGLSYNWDHSKKFTFDQANKLFNIEFYFNFDQVEEKRRFKDIINYYDAKDIFRIHEQHACSENMIYYFLRKGAAKSQRVMLENIDRNLADLNSNLVYIKRQIEEYEHVRGLVESGDLEVII